MFPPGSRSIRLLEPRGRLGGKVGSACEEFEDNKGIYWVNVSENSGAGSSGLMFLRVLVPAHPACPG